MNRKILISEDEKKHILGQYGLISEQAFCKRNVTTTPQSLGITVLSQDIQSIINLPADEWRKWWLEQKKNLRTVKQAKLPLEETCRGNTKYNGSTTLDSIMIKSIVDNESRSNYSKLKNESGSSASGQEQETSFIYTLNNLYTDFINIWNSEESGKNDLVVTLERTVTTLEPAPPAPINGGGATNLVLPQFAPNGDLYVNNWWEVTDNLKTQFQQKVLKTIEDTKKTIPGIQLILKSLSVETSASRLRNKEGAEKYSFLELSQNRNNSTANYIKEALAAAGVTGVDKAQVIQNFQTAKSETNPNGNGDGSSGPNPPEPYAFVPVGNYKMNTPGKDRNEAGTPLKDINEYEKFKFVKVTIVLDATIPPNTTTRPGVASPTKVVDFSYDIKIGDKSKKKRIPPPIKIGGGNYSGRPKKSVITDTLYDLLHFDIEKCAAYD